MISEPDALSKQKKIQYLDPADSYRRNFQRITSPTNTSFVWNHFKRHIFNQNQFLCDYCGLLMTTTSSNTTQMISHLKRKHRIEPKTNFIGRQSRNEYAAGDENFIEAIRQKHLRKNSPMSQQEDRLKDQLIDSDEIQKSRTNQQIDMYSQHSRRQDFNIFERQFPLHQSSKHAGNIYYEDNDENGEKQKGIFMKPRKIYTYPLQSLKIKKLRGPRGPYKQRNQGETNKQYWQNIFKNSHTAFQGLQKKIKKKEEKVGDQLKKNQGQQNELIIIQKATKQVRTEINNFMHSLPYNLLPSELCQRFLSRYSCSPSLFNQMIKKYHWSSLNDRKCANKLRTYYPHQIFVKVKKYEWSKGKQREPQGIQQQKNKQRAQEDNSQFDYKQLRHSTSNIKSENDKFTQQQNENSLKSSQQNITFIASASMRSNFAKFGSVIRIFKQKNLILSKPIDSVTIFFCGFDNSGSPLVFGVLILANESLQNYKQGFQYFFSTMASEVSKVIVVQKGIQNFQMIQKAVEQICKLTRSKIRLISHYNVKDLQEIFLLEGQIPQIAERSLTAMILNQVNIKKRIKLVQYCKPFLNQKMINKIESIVKSTDQQNPVWVGMNLQVKKIVSLKKLLITPFVWRENLAKFLMHFFWVQKKLIDSIKQSTLKWGYLSQHNDRIAFYEKVYQKYQVSYEIFDDNQQLFRLRNQLSAPIYQKLISLYITAVRYIKIQQTESPLIFRASFPRIRCKQNEKQAFQLINYSSMHIVKFNIEKNCWECNCLLQFWIGLPCPHIIRLLILYEGSINYYINSKWKVVQQNGKNLEDIEQEEKDFFAIMQAAVNVTKTNELRKRRTECDFYRSFWSQ